MRLYGAGRPGFAGTGNGSVMGDVLGWWRSVRAMVVTPGEVEDICKKYALRGYKVAKEDLVVFCPQGLCTTIGNLGTVAPDEFESLVLLMVVEGTFCS